MLNDDLLKIVYFLVAVLVVYEVAGSKPTVYLLILVILSILVVNANKIKSI